MTDNTPKDRELLPCPFCGSSVRLKEISNTNMYGVVCSDTSSCKGTGMIITLSDRGDGLGRAIDQWNTRADKQHYKSMAIEAVESCSGYVYRGSIEDVIKAIERKFSDD